MRWMMAAVPAALLVAACQRADEPIAVPQYGAALRHNMEAQIVPPPAAVFGLPSTPSERQQLAFERYRTGEVRQAPAVATTNVVPVSQ